MDKNEIFIEKARKIHGDKYDYSKVEYKNNSTKICIICPKHGEFWQTPNNHLRGQNCPKCSHRSTKYTIEEFIEQANNIHKNVYDYSKTKYINNKIKICIICPKHGEFWQTPNDHLDGKGCPSCSNTKKLTTEEFITKAKMVHGDKYDYSNTEYINSRDKVIIVCKKHGKFMQSPHSHLNGCGCPVCRKDKLSAKFSSTKDEFIEQARKIHGDRYDYSKVEYVNSRTKVCIICPTHGEFWQTPNMHLLKQGCPICNESHLEKQVTDALENNFTFLRGKHFSWLGKQHLDFYLQDYNIAIECQGVQHFAQNHFFEKLEIIQERDNRKKQLCKENGIKLIYYLNEEYNKYMDEGDIWFNDTKSLIKFLKEKS
jgi:rubrerythrin